MAVTFRARRRYSDEDAARVVALYRATGGNYYRAGKMAGVPRSTVVDMVARLGAEYGSSPQDADTSAALSAVEGASDPVTSDADTEPREALASRLATLVTLSEVRGLYMERLKDQDVISKTSAKDASSIVRDATTQIQLLTGQPTGRSETLRYVEPGALREHARRSRIGRATAKVIRETGPESTGGV